MYRNNPSQLVVPPQLQQLLSSNNNSNNNGNNNNNNSNNNNSNDNNNNSNNNNSPNGNNNNGAGNNGGGVNNNNPPITNSTSTSFGGSGQFEVSVPNSGNPAGIDTNINCLVSQNGNNIQLGLDLTPTSVPSSLQSTFNTNNDYLFNFDGTTSNSTSGTQITANAQGSLSSGSTFNLDLNGSIDQAQDTLTFTLTSTQNSQTSIITPSAISLYPNSGNNNNNSNNNGNNGGSGNNNNNNNSNGVNPTLDTSSSQINTATGKITLTFSITNSNSQDAKISKMGGTVINGEDQVTLGTVSLSSSVTISAGQTSQVVVSGTLTSQGKSDLSNNFTGDTSVDVEISGGSITVNGVTQSNSQTQDLGNINLVN
jgi:hypothetical protein